MFKNVSWLTDDDTVLTPSGASDTAFHCDVQNFTNSSCEVKNFTPAEEDLYLTWAASLELIGIPQVAVGTNDLIFQLVNDSQLDTGGVFSSFKNPLNNSIKSVFAVGEDFLDATGNKFYSAANYSKFEMGTGKLKKVFSENEFNCCIPTGQEITATTPKDQCCTGFIKNIDGPPVCCLPDFTDVTIYLNRYVSSEGRGLPDNAYDPKTGYIKDPGQVKLMAGQKNLCCSGKVMTGVAISQLSIPFPGESYLPPTSLTTSRRFIYSDTAVDSNPETGDKGSIYNLGVRWNNHLYCVPDGFN